MLKILSKITLVLLAILLALAAFFYVRARIHQGGPDTFGAYEFQEDGAFDLALFAGENLYLPEGHGQLRIMQLADPQIKFGFMTHDRKTMDLIDRAITAENPDICVVTGDLTLSLFTYDAYRYFADFMEEREQYWTITFGNHDSEFDASKYTLATLLSEYQYCLFSTGPSNVKGVSNFPINVYVGDSTVPSYSLIMMDSNMYPENGESDLATWAYDCFGEDQIAWYRWVTEGLRAINPEIQSSLFFHIPTVETAEMYYANELLLGREIPDAIDPSVFHEISGVTGTVCEADKEADVTVDEGYTVGIYYQGKNTGLYDTVRELGVTRAMFYGHDHVNTLSGYYGGIYLGYGLCCGYHTYPYFESSNLLTDLLSLSDQALYSGDNWVDINGNKLEKGVTMIEISLSDNYGSLTVTNVFDRDLSE